MTRIATDGHRRHRPEPVHLPPLAARTVAGLVAGLGLGVLLLAVPVVLLAAFGWPPPFPSESAWKYPHLFTNEFITSALALTAWAAWASLAFIVLREAVHALRWGVDPAHLKDAASPIRWLAGVLIGAVAALWPATANAATPLPAETTASLQLDHDDLANNGYATPLVWRTDTVAIQATTADNQTANPPVADAGTDAEQATDPTTGLRMVTVGRDDPTLWDIAENHLGDPTRYMEIYELNKDRTFDGGPLNNPAHILDGWELLIPDTATDPPLDDATGLRVVTVGPQNSTLWDIAENHLGDPTRYMEIFELNKDRTFEGGPFDNPAEINDGWQLLLPDTDAPPDEGTAETETPPAPPDGEGEVYEPPTINPAVPDEGSASTGDEEPTENPDSTTPQTSASDTASEGAEGEDGGLAAAFPFGVWLSAGTCLAAGTVLAIALRLRRRRTAQQEGGHVPVADEVMTGRLSDLEAIIETEARKLAQVVPEPQASEAPIVADPVVAVDTERAPVTLADLASAGVGLRGPGQRGVARAAILTAASAGARILVTEAADLRLELGAAVASNQVHFTPDLHDALQTPREHRDLVVVCADTDLDEATRPMLERFLALDGHSAFILGDWIPSSLVLEAAGTVKAAHGRAADANLRSHHIANQGTTATVLAGLAVPDTEPENEVVSEPAAPAGYGPEDTAGVAELAQPEPGPLLRLCLFGQPDVYIGDQPVPLKKGRRSRAFLTVLACAEGPVSRDELLEGVVGDMVEIDRAKNNFSAVAIDTRRALRDATGDTDADFYTYDRATETYELDRLRFTLDLDEFNDAEQAAALTTNPAEAAGHLEVAVALYNGDLAPDVETDTVGRLRDLYREKTVRILAKLIQHYTEDGDFARAEYHRGHRTRLLAAQGTTPRP